MQEWQMGIARLMGVFGAWQLSDGSDIRADRVYPDK